MKGHKGIVLSLIISYIPALLSCVLVAPAVFVIPLYQASLAAAAQDIIDMNTM